MRLTWGILLSIEWYSIKLDFRSVGGMLLYWKIWLNNESALAFLCSLLIEFCLGHWKKLYFISDHVVSH